MNRRLDILLRIVGWGLAIAGIILLFLMVIGVLKSPTLELIALFISIGFSIIIFEVSGVKSELKAIRSGLSNIRADFGELKSKFDLVWSDFKKRKL